MATGLNFAWSLPTPLIACISTSITCPGLSFATRMSGLVGMIASSPEKYLACLPNGWKVISLAYTL